jgi:phosphoribosyl-ATP pyrophosphohydrolase
MRADPASYTARLFQDRELLASKIREEAPSSWPLVTRMTSFTRLQM